MSIFGLIDHQAVPRKLCKMDLKCEIVLSQILHRKIEFNARRLRKKMCIDSSVTSNEGMNQIYSFKI